MIKKVILAIGFLILHAIFVFASDSLLEIHFIDAGEGDSILIKAPSGKTALVDAGNFITGLEVVQYLKKNNIYDLDYLIFTHPHLDHIGGAFFVLPMIGAGNIYDNGEDLSKIAKSEDVYRWYGDLVRKSSNYSILKAEDSLLLGEVELKVLWPNRPFISSNFNVNSLVIMVKYKAFRCLLTGDLTIPGEEELLKNKSYLEADILKVGHHGCDDAGSEEFLKAISPKISVISVDRDNIRGYPFPELLMRLEKLETRIYRTDQDGDIVIRVGEKGEITVETNREE